MQRRRTQQDQHLQCGPVSLASRSLSIATETDGLHASPPGRAGEDPVPLLWLRICWADILVGLTSYHTMFILR